MTTLTGQTNSIECFKQSGTSQIFKLATQIPDFFSKNLVDPNRVILILSDDPNAHERIFYYQYLKICQELRQGYPEIRRQNLKNILLSSQFHFVFPNDTQKYPYTNQQFKRIGVQFLQLFKDQQMTVDQALQKYPIADKVFTFMMRSLLIINKIAQETQQFIDKIKVLQILSNIFNIQFNVFGNCVKFVQSDIFAYENSPFQVYMIYLPDQQQQQNQKQQTQRQPINGSQNTPQNSNLEQNEKIVQKGKQQQKQEQVNSVKYKMQIHKKQRQKNQMYKSNTSNDTYQFMDYTSYNHNLFHSQNLSLHAMFLKQNNHSQKFNHQKSKAESKKSKNSSKIQIPEVVQEVFQFDSNPTANVYEKVTYINPMIIQDNFNMKTLQKIQNTQEQKDRIQNPQATKQPEKKLKCSQLSGFQSDEDGSKFKTTFLSNSTLQKTNQVKKQSQIIPSSQQIKTKLASYSLIFPKKESSAFSNTEIFSQTKRNSQLGLAKQPDFIPFNSYNNPNLIEINARKNNNIQISIFVNQEPSYRNDLYQGIEKQMNYTVKRVIPCFQDIMQQNNYGKNMLSVLNVTKQFTNSYVLNEMPSFQRRNIRKIRQRARAFRKNLNQIH